MSATATIKKGGGNAALFEFREVWLVDFEFQAPPGERPRPLCMAAREMLSSRLIRLWRGELTALHRAPFDTGPDSLFVAYYASAELGCFLVLGWPMPARVLDLYAEHRCLTNGTVTPHGHGLVDALALRGLAHIDPGEKEHMRRLVVERASWSEAEQAAILDYCQSDVDALAALLPRMAPELDLPRALLRGRYMAAVARMEWTGIPIDAILHASLKARWGALKDQLIAEVDRAYAIYDGSSFRTRCFGAYLRRAGIAWPRLPSGALDLKDNVFKQQALLHPLLEPLRQLRATLGKLRLNDIGVGSDGRNRCPLWAFASKTGRNQPSNAQFVFGPSKWIRGLIKPPEGQGRVEPDRHGDLARDGGQSAGL